MESNLQDDMLIEGCLLLLRQEMEEDEPALKSQLVRTPMMSLE